MIEIDVAMFESEVLRRIFAALDGGGSGKSARLALGLLSAFSRLQCHFLSRPPSASHQLSTIRPLLLLVSFGTLHLALHGIIRHDPDDQ